MGLFSSKQPLGSTQDILKFAEIRDDTIILKDGNLRQILLCASINFALKSEQEQTAIVYQYQNFLNSLNFPIQIVLQSKKLDLTNYIAKLEKISSSQSNELLKMQTEDYVGFIKKLVDMANIMDKRFYVVVPFAVPIQSVGPKISKNRDETAVTYTPTEFDKYKIEIEQRVGVVTSGLAGIGVRAAVLNTQQIIELLYNVYNPEEAAKEKLIEAEELQAEVISSELLKPEQKNAK